MRPGSRRKLKPSDARRFAEAESSLFRQLAEVVCASGTFPEKELHECWQMGKLVHEAFPEQLRVADIAAGHGLLGWILVLLARLGEHPRPRTAVAIDIARPRSADVLARGMLTRWPELAGAWHFVEGSIDSVLADEATLFVAAHACGSLSDRLILAAVNSQSPLAIMPCCHSLRKQQESLAALAAVSGSSVPRAGNATRIDQWRMDALRSLGYQVEEASISPEITAFHRIILGRPGVTRVSPTPERRAPRRPLCGELRAFQQIDALNVSDIGAVQALAQRPSREWIRSFDLSFWVEDDDRGTRLAAALRELASARGETVTVVHLDRYQDPVTGRLAMTFRVVLQSATCPITRADALALRRAICEGLPDFVLRGPV